ncbi:hypothetical protein D3C73_1593360 [compost metagenome]
MRGNLYAAALTVEAPGMVRTLQQSALAAAQRQVGPAVRAVGMKGLQSSVLIAK